MINRTARAAVTPMRQRTQFSCMAASMAMCLRALGHDVTEDEVNRVMGARPMKGAAWEQALATAQHYGCRATLTMPSTVQQLKAWTDAGVPVMIAWNPEGRPWSHASVVFDVDDELNVHVADPNIPNPTKTVRIVSEDEFYGKWYEKFPDYLVRRPACAINREITVDGRPVMAKTASKVPADAEKVPGTKFWVSKDPSKGPIRGQKPQYKVYNEHGGVIGGSPDRAQAVEMAKKQASVVDEALIDRVAQMYLARAKKKNKPESMKTRMKAPTDEPKVRNEVQRAVAEAGGMSGAGTHQNKAQRGEGTKGKGKAQRHPKHKMDPRREVQASRARYEDWAKLVPGSEVENSKEQRALQSFWDFCQGQLVEAVKLDDAIDMVAWDLGYQGHNLRTFAPALLFLGNLRRRPVTREYKDGQAAAKENKTAAGYTNGWVAFKDGWKFVGQDILAYLLWEDAWEHVRDPNVPDEFDVADPELLADGIPELEENYYLSHREWEKWKRQGWWPKPVKVPNGGLHLTILHRPTKKEFEARFKKNEARKALDWADKAIESIRGRKYPRWMSPVRTADADSRYKGNPDGLPVYDHVVDHGVDQPLSGGHDVMKALQNEYLKEQGREPREPNHRLGAGIQIGDTAVWGGKRVQVVDTHGYPVKTVDIRWTESGVGGSRDEVSGHKRGVPVSQLRYASQRVAYLS